MVKDICYKYSHARPAMSLSARRLFLTRRCIAKYALRNRHRLAMNHLENLPMKHKSTRPAPIGILLFTGILKSVRLVRSRCVERGIIAAISHRVK